MPGAHRLKKTLFLLNVGDYAPELTALTYPLLYKYAEKIGANVHIIRERKFHDWDLDYEKLQIYDLAREMDVDWALYIDSDALVHPDLPDLTEVLAWDTVAHHGVDHASMRWRYDDYFRRDGRHISSCNWFAMASRWCLDLWRPLDDLTPAEAYERITTIRIEDLSGVVKREHLVSDYALSRNIARFGLKCTTVRAILERLGLAKGSFFHHLYLVPLEQKIEEAKRVLAVWNGEQPSGTGGQTPAPAPS